MFVSPAYAQTPGGGGAFDMITMLPLVLIFVVFYFLIIRPQQKRQREHRAMIESVKRGDRVVTSGGLVGVVARVDDAQEVTVQIADNVRVKVRRAMIAEIVTKGAAPADKPEKAEKAKPEAPSEPTYYQILGIEENASPGQIQAAFDAKSQDAAARDAMETLGDPVKRRLYDKLGHDEYVRLARG